MIESQDRIIRSKEASKMIGVSRTTLWRFERDGNFPKHLKLGERSVGWRLSEVLAWLESRQAA